MTKVNILAAGHQIEIEADGDPDVIAKLAHDLWTRTKEDPEHRRVGFSAGGITNERAYGLPDYYSVREQP